jgi:hypothetical protein
MKRTPNMAEEINLISYPKSPTMEKRQKMEMNMLMKTH